VEPAELVVAVAAAQVAAGLQAEEAEVAPAWAQAAVSVEDGAAACGASPSPRGDSPFERARSESKPARTRRAPPALRSSPHSRLRPSASPSARPARPRDHREGGAQAPRTEKRSAEPEGPALRRSPAAGRDRPARPATDIRPTSPQQRAQTAAGPASSTHGQSAGSVRRRGYAESRPAISTRFFPAPFAR